MTIQKESKKTKQAMATRLKKYNQWPDLAVRSEKHFNHVAQKARDEEYPDNLYVSRNDINRQIQLFSGTHPIDVTHKRGQNDNKSVAIVHTEEGAALVVSQSIPGYTAIFLYPYKSDKQRQKNSHIIWKVFESPEKITLRVLDSATKDFFTYMRVSSAVLAESRFDRLRIRYIELRGKKFSGEFGFIKILLSRWILVAISAFGSIASIFSLWK